MADEQQSAPLWVMSFADLNSLLVTFFILLLTFSSQDEEQVRRVGGAMRERLGVMAERKTISTPIPAPARPGPKRLDQGSSVPSRRREQESERRLEALVQSPEYDVKIDILNEAGGMRIRLADENLFEPGGVSLSTLGQSIIEEIGNILHDRGATVIVEAHTDDLTYTFSRYRTAEDLTRAMALDVARILTGRCRHERSRVGLSPMGSVRPAAPNDSAVNRTRNRRIEIRVLGNET